VSLLHASYLFLELLRFSIQTSFTSYNTKRGSHSFIHSFVRSFVRNDGMFFFLRHRV